MRRGGWIWLQSVMLPMQPGVVRIVSVTMIPMILHERRGQNPVPGGIIRVAVIQIFIFRMLGKVLFCRFHTYNEDSLC